MRAQHPGAQRLVGAFDAAGGGLVGLDLGDVIKVTMYVKRESDRPAVVRNWEAAWPDVAHRPARRMLAEELPKLVDYLGTEGVKAGRYDLAARLFEEIVCGDYVDFLTLPAYQHVP